jgi:hypothetical protein
MYLLTWGDIPGFVLVSHSEWEAFKEAGKKATHTFTYSLGIPQHIWFGDGNEFLEKIHFQKLTDQEYAVFYKFYSDKKFGTTDWWDLDIFSSEFIDRIWASDKDA